MRKTGRDYCNMPIVKYEKLPLEFYQRNTTKVAKELLGKKFFHKKNGQITAGIIIETEAYLGLKDPACHTFNGRRTARVESMYQNGGHAYVYLIYGIHCCMNIVTQDEKRPEAVLIRALWPDSGLRIMQQRRNMFSDKQIKDLCSGPGKLCQAMGINRADNGLLVNEKKIWVTEGIPFAEVKSKIIASPRVGIDYAGEAIDWPLRFTLKI